MDIHKLVRQAIAETTSAPAGWATMTVWRNEMEIEVTAPYWVVSPGAPAQRGRGGNFEEDGYPAELTLGTATDSADREIPLTPEEDLALYEIAQTQVG